MNKVNIKQCYIIFVFKNMRNLFEAIVYFQIIIKDHTDHKKDPKIFFGQRMETVSQKK